MTESSSITLQVPAAETQSPPKASAKIPKGIRGGWAIFARLYREYMAQHLWRLIIAGLAMLVIAASQVAIIKLLEPAVDQVLVAKDFQMLMLVAGAVVVAFIVKALATVTQTMLVGYVTLKASADLQITLFKRLIHSDLARHTQTHSGRIAAHFLNDTQIVRTVLGQYLPGIAKDVAVAVGLIFYIYLQNFTLAVVGTIVLPLIALMVRKLGKRTHKASSKGMAETGTMSSLIADSLDGVRIVKAYGREDHEIARMTASVERRLKHQFKALYSRLMTSPVTDTLTGVALASILLYGGNETIAGRMTPGELVSVLFAIAGAYRPLKAAATYLTHMAEGIAAAERVLQAIDVEPTIVDRPDAVDLAITDAHVRLEQVGFGYRDGIQTLDSVTIDVPGGSKVALVGPSGAGKSTILNLIPRFYDIQSGRILIDGQDIRSVPLSSLRSTISLVTQDPYLFDDTVRANIAYGRPEATQQQLEDAAIAAAAHDFISALPEGYDTVVGENGVTLSGGQRQRLAIARALLADSPILLLDEATSALDTESERLIQTALRRLMQGRTSIVIAHRLSTIKDADIIFVLNKGRVTAQGTHEELLAADGLYAKLYHTQFEAGQAEAP